MVSEAEFLALVSGLVTRDEAWEITWGGAAANEAARLRRRNEGDDADDDPYPAPEIFPALVPLWHTWFDARRSGAVGQEPMSGSPHWDSDAVARIASTHGEPFDALFLARFGVMFSAYRIEVAKLLERKK